MSELPVVFMIVAAMTISSIVFLVNKMRRGPIGTTYPPGPKALYPILGNLLDMPKRFQWITYAEWGKRYGDIMHVSIFGQHLVIINSQEIANELLEKRSRNYSDRPHIPIMDMNGWYANMGLKHYGNEWRRDRRVLHQRFRRGAAHELHSLELAKSRALLHDLLRNPKDFVSYFQLYPASTMMYLLYGHEVTSRNDPLIDMTFETILLSSGSVFPGTTAINMFPALRHLPTWLPVLRDIHQACLRCRQLLRKLEDVPFDSVKKHLAEGTEVHSWVSELIKKNNAKGKETIPEDVIKALGVSTFAAAMETTAAILTTFILAMVLYPEVQNRAQAEIDSVLGDTKLPTHQDRPLLPYVDALFRELLRWHGPAPLGIPHATMQDDVYNGYYIPKGTTIITNQWAMWRNEQIYPNAEEFRPERFLSPEGSLIDLFPPTFGFGRRACVGKSMADASIWIAIVSILFVYRITKAKDKFGNIIEVSEKFGDDGIISAPLPFQCSITPRSEAARNLILDNPPLKLDSNPMFY